MMNDARSQYGEPLSPVKRAIVELRELRARLDECEQRNSEPIALVGVGCRFPGGADDPESFWNLLRDGVDAVTRIPADRWDQDALYDPCPDAPGKMSTRWGGFLDDVDRFDDEFFGISPREAVGIDPQQRLLLEVCWRALEDAGHAPERLFGNLAGVFMGVASIDYAVLQAKSGSTDLVDAYYATGFSHSVASGRVAYVLGLQGPAISVDTACSSSLVAVHLACQSLRAGECQLALAGGINLILAPELHISLSRARMLAPDGRCKTFDAAADGFVRAEGCGVVVLKRLSDALADGDRIRALIRGSAINQDGRSSGLTVPNGPSQEAVIRAALRNAGIGAERLQYVEAHGTGTALGDPIEARALAAVLEEVGSTSPVRIGSVKTNIGHAESAAGVAGLIKVVLALNHDEIPPNLHFQESSPHIDWSLLPLEVATKRTPWPAGSSSRVAGVSSFGFSGTNAHVIVEEPPAHRPSPATIERPLHLLTLSARTSEALRELARRYADTIAGSPAELADLAYTANAGRFHFSHRAALTAASPAEAVIRLRALAAGDGEATALCGRADPATSSEVVFLFTGQGSQYIGMGRQLYQSQPTFRQALDRCAELLADHVDEPLNRLLFPPDGWPSRLDETRYAQPALFALEYALAELWASWGVEPAALLGHSVGEYVAACRAGVFSLADGLKLVAAQGRLIQGLPGGGMMSAVFADAETVQQALAPHAAEVAIAAYNGPEEVVIAGRGDAVRRVQNDLEAKGVRFAPLAVSHANHSPLVGPMLEEFARVAASVHYAEPRLTLVSGLTGDVFGTGEVPDAVYWVRHAREAIRFAHGIETLSKLGYRMFVEVGPTTTLCNLGASRVPGGSTLWLPSLRRGHSEWETLLGSLAGLYRRGVRVDWKGFDRDYRRRIVTLPGYPFDRKRFWFQAPPHLGADRPLAPRWPAIVAAGERQAVQVPIDLNLHSYSAKYQALDRLSTAYMISALRSLGAYAVAGEALRSDDLVNRLGVKPIYRSLMDTWLRRLVAKGLLRVQDGLYIADRPLPEPLPEMIVEDADGLFAQESVLLRWVVGSGRILPEVLTGVESALEVLFPGGSADFADEIYHRVAASRYFNNIVRAVVEAFAAGAAPGAPMRILEVGAGTGGTTALILPALPAARVVYDFTDVSDFFLDRARRRFVEFPFVRYGLLDLEKDPHEQGYAAAHYDIVVAANVLHATRDVGRTVESMRSLLAPDGLLLLYEVTDPPSYFDTTVALIEGWQSFSDGLRVNSPLLNTPQWLEVLRTRGFVEAVALPAAGSPAEVIGSHVFVARVPGGAVSAATVLRAPVPVAAGLTTTGDHDNGHEPIADEDGVLRRLVEMPPSEHVEVLVDFVRRHVARVLRRNVPDAIDRSQRLMDLGLDSLMAVELRDRMSTALHLDRPLPATLIFDFPSVGDIASYLATRLGGAREEKAAESRQAQAGAERGRLVGAAALDALSDAEVEQLLLEKLETL
jgi:acyl transferase domain-containing protein/SAM-dependent methyltransferase/acyl carrier protein